AVAAYRGFEPSSFRISVIFDREIHPENADDPNAPKILPATDIVRVIRERGIQMGIVAVPAPEAQHVADQLIDGGVRAILNYAPVTIKVPDNVWVREIDPISAMQSMTYYLEKPVAVPSNGTDCWRQIG